MGNLLQRFFAKNVDDEIVIYCFLDRDYLPDEAIETRYDEAKSAGINLTIWSVKELENFLIIPTAIARLIANKTKKAVDFRHVEAAVQTDAGLQRAGRALAPRARAAAERKVSRAHHRAARAREDARPAQGLHPEGRGRRPQGVSAHRRIR